MLPDAGRDAEVASEDAASDSAPNDGAPLDTASEDAGVGWHRVMETPGCPLYQADPAVVGFAPLTWASCGTGCRVTSGGLSKYPANRGTSAGRYSEGDAFLLLDEAVDAGIRLRTVRVSDGTTIGAVELRTTTVQCLPLGADNDAMFLAFAGPKGTKTFSVGHVRPGGIQWPSTWIPLPATPTYAFEWAGGYGLALLDGSIRSLAVPTDSGLFTLAAGEPSFSADGYGDLSVWTAPGTGGLDVVRGYHQKRKVVETYATRAGVSLMTVGLSNEVIATAGATGPSAAEGRYTSVRYYWSKRPELPSDVSLVEGPALAIDGGPVYVKTAGDFVAAIGCNSAYTDNTKCSLHVTQMSTRKVWRIKPRPSEMFAKLIAVTPTEIVVGVVDYPMTAISVKSIHRYLRFDASQLDALATAW